MIGCDSENPQSRCILCVIRIVNTDLAPVCKTQKQSVSLAMVELEGSKKHRKNLSPDDFLVSIIHEKYSPII